MISKTDYDVLLPLRDEKWHVLNNGPGSRISDLADRKLLRLDLESRLEVINNKIATPPAPWRMLITTLGLNALEEFENAAKEQAKHKRDNATNRKLQIIMPLITFLLGVLVEHFSNLVNAAIRLFRVK